MARVPKNALVPSSAVVTGRATAKGNGGRRRRWIGWAGVLAAVAVVAGVAAVGIGDENGPGTADGGTGPVVGGDLHTVTTVGDSLFVAGHTAVGVSRDNGTSWQQVSSLQDADPMGWAVTPDIVLAGGHPGIFRSTDQGRTFVPATGAAAVPDAHALGGSGTTVYLASPQRGVMVSSDSGHTWQVRNAQAGRSFMGTILVDPANIARLIVPDMSSGLAISTDGGRTWAALGGPAGVMSAAWNPTDPRQIVVVGMNGGALSRDAGATWQQIDLPPGASAIAYDAAGRTVFAAALNGDRARVYRSTDTGTTWTPTA